MPVPHKLNVPVPPPSPRNISFSSTVTSYNNDVRDENFEADYYFPGRVSSCLSAPLTFNQSELNDLVRDLGLSKDNSLILGSRLQEKNLLFPDTTFSWYKQREVEFLPFFSEKESLTYCNNVPDLLNKLGLENYTAKMWRLFMDSSKCSLKAVLLHNGNKYASIPLAHSVHLKEIYENLKTLLEAINYNIHQWTICGDLKIISMILGQQSGYTKYPCFLCEWDSRAKNEHWTKKQWLPRKNLTPGSMNVVKRALVESGKILLPPLHIKLGFMKQFVKALNKEGNCFKYLCEKFPHLSDAKIKEGIFVDPQIRLLTKDKKFEKSMSRMEQEAWIAFKNVITGFLETKKDPNYKAFVSNMLYKFQKLGCKMNLKVHFLYAHLDYFPEGSLGDVSEKQGERFNQDLKEMERRYQGRWDARMLADFCWTLTRDNPEVMKKRQAKKRNFEHTISKDLRNPCLQLSTFDSLRNFKIVKIVLLFKKNSIKKIEKNYRIKKFKKN